MRELTIGRQEHSCRSLSFICHASFPSSGIVQALAFQGDIAFQMQIVSGLKWVGRMDTILEFLPDICAIVFWSFRVSCSAVVV